MSVFNRQHEGHEAEGLGAEVSLDSGAGQLERHYEGQLERHQAGVRLRGTRLGSRLMEAAANGQ